MGDLGATCLWMALALAGYAFAASVAGQARGAPALVDSGRKACYVLVLVLLVATLSLVQSFITRDFSLAYVAAHSNLAMPNIYTWVAFYAGNEGSLLYIAFALSVMAAVAIWLAPAATRPTLAWTVAVLMFIELFFIAVMAFMANPFQRLPFAVPTARHQPAAHPLRDVLPPAGIDGRAGGDQHTLCILAGRANRRARRRRVD